MLPYIQMTSSDQEIIKEGVTTILPADSCRSKPMVNYNDSHDDCFFPDIPIDPDVDTDGSLE